MPVEGNWHLEPHCQVPKLQFQGGQAVLEQWLPLEEMINETCNEEKLNLNIEISSAAAIVDETHNRPIAGGDE